MTKQNKLKELLQKIVETPSVSGNEGCMSEFILDHLDKNNQAVKFEIDFKGNLICQKGDNPSQFAISAHMDKVGFLVSGIGKKYLEVVNSHSQGKLDYGYKYQVWVIDSTGNKYSGILKNESKKDNKLKVYVEEAGKFEIGNFVSYKSNFSIIGDTISSAYLDNSMGVAVVLDLIGQVQNCTFIFSALEEMGSQGIGYAVSKNKPINIIVVDTTYDIKNGKGAKLHSGKGPSICIKDKFFGDPGLINFLVKTAKFKKIPYQMEVWEEAGSDLIGINSSSVLTKSCFVGFPIKNPGKSIQTGSLKDMENMEKLLKTLFEKI